MKMTFQVNLNFGPRNISAMSHTGVVVFASTMNKLIENIKQKFGLAVEDLILTFQPEGNTRLKDEKDRSDMRG